MNKKPYIIIAVLIFAFVAVILIMVYQGRDTDAPENIGGDTDSHGCLVAAGYNWCPSTQKCQRMWEEYCPEFKEQFKIEHFEDCVEAGNPVMESYPRRCQSESGQVFTDEIGNELDKSGLIRLDNPRPNQKISSPLTVTGEARGNWFFEAEFPVVLVNWDGLIIAQSNARAREDWMTEDFVPFEAELTFDKPETYDNGALILQKANPSGLPENDDALEIPIAFE